MRVLLEPARPGTPAAAALANAGRATRTGAPTSLIVIHESRDFALGTHDAGSVSPALAGAAQRVLADAASLHADFELDGRRTRAFVQFLAPAPNVLICGAGPDAEPVVSTALGLGWRVSVVDHRPAYAAAARFPGAQVRRGDAGKLRRTVSLEDFHAVVVMSHHLPSDVAYLAELAEAGVPHYVGLLGPHARRERIAHELGAAAERLRPRLHGPVGLAIGAVTPQGIALSIIAEIHDWLGRRR